MTYMLCRNRVENFARWKRGFDSHAGDHHKTGLTLQRMWRDKADGNQVFFMFEVQSMKKAKAFIGAPEAAEAGRKFGVLDGEYHFVRETKGTRQTNSLKRKSRSRAN